MAITEQQRKDRQAAYSRAYRARKAQERAQAIADASHGRTGAAAGMLDAVNRSVAAMKWLEQSDDAAVALTRLVAEQIDELCAAGKWSQMVRHSMALSRLLNELGGTPRVRMQYELRSRRAGVPAADVDASVAPVGNVSKFERPKKRSK